MSSENDTNLLVAGANEEAIFAHPDKTDLIDRLVNPVAEIATYFHAIGPVIKGHGAGDPLGSQVQFGDIVLPHCFLTAQACASDVYAAVSWDAVRTLYTSKAFSSKCFIDSLGLQGPTLTTMDPPEHTKYRRVVQPGFLPKSVGKYNAEFIRPTMARRFAELKGRGKANFVRDLTPYMAFEINGAIIGFDPGDAAFLATCRSMAFGHDPEAIAKAMIAQNNFARNLMALRRVDPRDDLISYMIRQEVDGEPISESNLLGLVNILLQGGIDTIYKQSGNITCMLLDHPEQFDLLRADRSLIPRFVEEAMRYESITTHFPRMAAEDTVLEGTPIPAGGVVFGMIFAADRDPSRWNNPNVLDVMRPAKPTIAFSAGTHSCLGAQVARLALSCFIEHLIDDLPGLRWDPELPKGKITGWTQRAALNLPVVWDAA